MKRETCSPRHYSYEWKIDELFEGAYIAVKQPETGTLRHGFLVDWSGESGKALVELEIINADYYLGVAKYKRMWVPLCDLLFGGELPVW